MEGKKRKRPWTWIGIILLLCCLTVGAAGPPEQMQRYASMQEKQTAEEGNRTGSNTDPSWKAVLQRDTPGRNFEFTQLSKTADGSLGESSNGRSGVSSNENVGESSYETLEVSSNRNSGELSNGSRRKSSNRNSGESSNENVGESLNESLGAASSESPGTLPDEPFGIPSDGGAEESANGSSQELSDESFEEQPPVGDSEESVKGGEEDSRGEEEAGKETEDTAAEDTGKEDEGKNSLLSSPVPSPLLAPKAGGAKNIVVTTPETLYAFGGYRSVHLSPDGHISDGQGISPIPLHFHHGADGNTAFCLGVNLANPDTEVTYEEADLGEAYGDQLEQVSAIVQNSILKFSDDRKENALPEAWGDLTYEEAEYAAQLAIWRTLLGKPGNESAMDGQGWFNDAWLYQNIYFPRMENLPEGKDIKGFYEYLLNTRTVAEPTAQVTVGEPEYAEGMFEIPLSVQTEHASAQTVVMLSGLAGEPRVVGSDGTEIHFDYDENADTWSCTVTGTVRDTMTLCLTAKENEEKTIQCNVYAKSNAVSSNLVYLIPSASHYQNLIKVEPKEVKTAEAAGECFLPRVTADAEIRKVEKGTNLPVSGIEFHVWSDQGFDQRLTTDGDGICYLENLLPGIYQYQEEKRDGYVTNREIYTFTVEPDGRVVGQVQSRDTSFAVENLRYCDLTVVKQVKKEDIVWAHGNPTFLFSVSGTDLNGVDHTYWGSLVFTEENAQQEPDVQGYISLSYTFTHVPMGTAYSVKEEKCNRYLLTGVSSADENVTINQLEEPIYDGKKDNSDFFDISVNLQEKPTGTAILFQNEKVRQDDYSHTSMAENRIPVRPAS